MTIFQRKKSRDKVLKIKVETDDLSRVDAINKQLADFGGDKIFDLESKLYAHFISLVESAEKELIKLEKKINEGTGKNTERKESRLEKITNSSQVQTE